MLYYDDEAHEYSDGWNVLPSVTQLLSSYFHIDPSHYAPGAAERGTEAHELCAAYALGDRSRIVNPYARAFADWLFDTGAQVLEVEKMIKGNCAGVHYAGRFDLTVNLGGRVLVDLKTGVKAPYFHAQVAAYSRVEKPARAMVLYLRRDGTYKPDWLTSAQLVEGIRVFSLACEAWRHNVENHRA